jgi:hypothetical protein
LHDHFVEHTAAAPWRGGKGCSAHSTTMFGRAAARVN